MGLVGLLELIKPPILSTKSAAESEDYDVNVEVTDSEISELAKLGHQLEYKSRMSEG
jgi:hypothetical protein